VCGERHTHCLAEADGAVYSFGAGDSYQIGIMDNEDQRLPQRATGLGGSSPSTKVQYVAAGVSCSAAVTEAGDVYVWGYGVDSPCPRLCKKLTGNFFQAIGIGRDDNVIALSGIAQRIFSWQFDEDGQRQAGNKPHEIKSLSGKKIAHIATGKSHDAVVTQDGKLFIWGSNSDYQLGLGIDSTLEYMPAPRQLVLGCRITRVACSAQHTLILTDTGDVMSWGIGSMGRLGHKSDLDLGEPTVVNKLREHHVTEIAVGANNSGCVTDKHEAFMWGLNTHGQLGNGTHMSSLEPTRVTFASEGDSKTSSLKVVGIAIGGQHAGFLDAKQRVFMCGDNQYGQCAQGSTTQDTYDVPVLVSYFALGKLLCSQLECGDQNTFALTTSGRVFGWGSDETHQLCTEEGYDQPFPVEIKFPAPAALHHEKKKTKTPAAAETKQAAEGKSSSASAAEKISRISVSSIDCAALGETGAAYVWGWSLGHTPHQVMSMQKEGVKARSLACGQTAILFST
jgi:alpha-tubulin suppressor-like RCC1 family protein